MKSARHLIIVANKLAIKHFNKIAVSELKFPQVIVDEISQFIKSYFCYHLAEYLDIQIENIRQAKANQQLKNCIFARGICKQNITYPNKSDLEKQSKIFEFPIEIFKMETFPDLKSEDKTIKILVVFNDQKSSSHGSWSSATDKNFLGKLEINQDLAHHANRIANEPDEDKALRYVPFHLNLLENIVEHEIQHGMQDFIDRYVIGDQKYQTGGLPSKKIRELEYTPQGYFTWRTPEDIAIMRSKGLRDQPHQLRDREFYTELSTNINAFKYFKAKIPATLHHDFALCWVGHIKKEELINKLKEFSKPGYDESLDAAIDVINYFIPVDGTKFFNALKTHQPEKYGKAVSVFMNAVE